MAFRRASVEGLEFALHLGRQNDSLEGHDDVDFVRRVYAHGGTAVWSPHLQVDHWVDPSRMTLRYLVRLERDRARTRIRATRPHRGPKLFGIPGVGAGGPIGGLRDLRVLVLHTGGSTEARLESQVRTLQSEGM